MIISRASQARPRRDRNVRNVHATELYRVIESVCTAAECISLEMQRTGKLDSEERLQRESLTNQKSPDKLQKNE